MGWVESNWAAALLAYWACLEFGFFFWSSGTGFQTRFTRNNFGYRDLLLEIVIGFFEFGFFGFGLGFFGFGLRASGNMPSHRREGLVGGREIRNGE